MNFIVCYNLHMEKLPFEEKKPEVKDESSKTSRRSLLKGIVALGGTAALSTLTGQKAESRERTPRENNLENKDYIQRIEKEAKKAAKLIEIGNPYLFFESPYLLFALYCSDHFLKKLSIGNLEHDIAEQVIKRFADKITPEIRERYVLMLDKISGNIPKTELLKTSSPLERFAYGQGKNHPDAIDLFIKEGTPVKAMRTGMAVAAERTWKKEDPFSVASLKGGNSVIIYNMADKAFYRYCHLENVFINQGEKIIAGTKIGTVGHSGLNASKPGHGEHLHFEINQYERESKKVRPLLEDELRMKIEIAKKIN